MPQVVTKTPFGNPDGSRSDIQDVVENFITFEELRASTGLGIRPDDLSPRVIVGAKGSGKTVYLRRLRAAAANNESVYADIVQQDLPATSNIVKFCQCFTVRDLTEKWMQLWYCAIMRAVTTHLLHARQLTPYLSEEQREELEGYPEDIVPRRRREVSVYSQVTDIIHSHHTAHAFARFFDHPAWSELSATVNDIISSTPPMYFFIDSVDEEYASAPTYWLQCQKGLFFRAMRFLRDQHFGGRLHIIVCVRDHVLASVLRGEHQNRYRGEPHITSLAWDYGSAEFFLKEKIARLDEAFLFREPQDGPPTIEDWLGCSMIENRGRRIEEPILQYLLRHTRLLPRDIVILGNKLTEVVVATKRKGAGEIPAEAIRRGVRDVSRSFGNEQLAICGNHIASSGMPADAARHGYDEVYTGDTEFARGLSDKLREVIQLIGKDRIGKDDLELAALYAHECFGEKSDALSVLWQNRLLGYVEPSPDGQREVFFSELSCDHFNLPRDKDRYLLHSCMIDATEISAVGSPVGQGGMQNPAAGIARDPAGRTCIGNYAILGVIGRGAMGTVYLAQDLTLKRRVAIKVLPETEEVKSGDLARFHREAQVLAALQHPNIATIFTLEDDNGSHFITMEFVPGETLAHLIHEGSLTVPRTLGIGRQIAAALVSAHQKSIIHRDIKPSNIMVSPDDEVKVLDFGLAKVLTQPTGDSESTWPNHGRPSQPGSLQGTLGYMSPELLTGRKVDNRSDIWAFGCCLFECLTGQKAFESNTLAESMVATLEREPDWNLLENVPGEVRDLLQRTMKKAPGERLSDLSDAVEILGRIIL